MARAELKWARSLDERLLENAAVLLVLVRSCIRPRLVPDVEVSIYYLLSGFTLCSWFGRGDMGESVENDVHRGTTDNCTKDRGRIGLKGNDKTRISRRYGWL